MKFDLLVETLSISILPKNKFVNDTMTLHVLMLRVTWKIA